MSRISSELNAQKFRTIFVHDYMNLFLKKVQNHCIIVYEEVNTMPTEKPRVTITMSKDELQLTVAIFC